MAENGIKNLFRNLKMTNQILNFCLLLMKGQS